jgi:hypothetical protein
MFVDAQLAEFVLGQSELLNMNMKLRLQSRTVMLVAAQWLLLFSCGADEMPEQCLSEDSRMVTLSAITDPLRGMDKSPSVALAQIEGGFEGVMFSGASNDSGDHPSARSVLITISRRGDEAELITTAPPGCYPGDRIHANASVVVELGADEGILLQGAGVINIGADFVAEDLVEWSEVVATPLLWDLFSPSQGQGNAEYLSMRFSMAAESGCGGALIASSENGASFTVATFFCDAE